MTATTPCIFCQLSRERIWLASDCAIAFYDAYPVAEGHALVIPRKHLASIFDLPEAEYDELWRMVLRVRAGLHESFKPDGINIGINDGIAAGQTISHAHIHVIPRGLALRLDLNPDAPDAVVFGKGPRIVARAQRLLDSGIAVPAYVKRATNSWEYLGEYRATAIRRDDLTLRKYGATRRPGTVAGVLFLEPATEPKIQVTGGGFADPQTRKEVEAAAIKFATRELTSRGFHVRDDQRENRGYDLFAFSPSGELLVEVKGTDSPEPRFFLTRNERRCCTGRACWRLFVVCNARTNPHLHEYTASEMDRNFTLEPLAWECTIARP
jgi:diadenosine tetraphosphate (Ap4A) HIT family hydrolase